MKSSKALHGLFVIVLTLLLASCGAGIGNLAGGVGTGGTGIGGTGIGTVTGFGSLVVDGNIYSSATAEYLEGNDQEEAAPSSALSVALGQQVQIQTDDQGKPTTVLVEPTLIGAASAVSAVNGSMTVNGVAVRVNSNAQAGPVTYFSGLSGLGEISNGMKLEVHGLYGVDALGQGYIQATRITQLPAATTVTRITGVVSNLNPGAGTFRIGATTIVYNASTTRLPEGIALASGQLVNVWSPDALSGGQVIASVIRVRTLQGLSGPAVVSGLVSALAGNQFSVSGIAVDASAPSLAAVAQSLSRGDYVVVSGQADSGTGKLIASSIHTTATLPAAVELKGTITDYVNSANFLVRGVSVDASSAAVIFAGGSAADLANGVYVEIHGSVEGNAVKATSVEIHAATPEDATVEFVGTVSALSGGSFILTLPDGTTTYNVTLADNVGYENGSASQLVDGARIEVEATWTASGLLAYGIEFRDLGLPGEASYETSGIAYDVTATSFSINGLTILINGVDATSLANGVEIEVHFIVSDGEYLAQAISVED